MDSILNIDPMSVLCYGGALILVTIGIIGTVIPAIPGLTLMALGGVLAGVPNDFQMVGPWSIGFLVFVALLGFVIDALSQSLGAKKVGASKAGIIGSIIGTFIGLFLGGLFGLLVMPFVGAFVGELWAKRDMWQAGRVGVATWIGLVVGTALNLALAFVMVGVLLFDWIRYAN